MADLLQRFVAGAVNNFLVLLFVLTLLLVIELAAPRGKRPSVESRLRSFVFLSLSVPFTVAAMLTFSWVYGSLGLHPLAILGRIGGLPPLLGAVLAAVLGAFIGDFFFYWYHRLQHARLWRFHRVHHSVREMSGWSAYHHVSEEWFRSLFVTAPVTFLVGDPTIALPVVALVTYVQGHYLHSSTRLNLGPLRYLFQDNRFHRIHHSLEQRHFDKNFGAVTPLWDILFGTAYFPEPDEWPGVGLEDVPEIASIRGYIALPWAGAPAPASTPEPEARPA